MRREDPESDASQIASGVQRCWPATAAEGQQTKLSEGLRYRDPAHYQSVCWLLSPSASLFLSTERMPLLHFFFSFCFFLVIHLTS